MGGYCSFLFARDYPEVPSAVVPISGGWGILMVEMLPHLDIQ